MMADGHASIVIGCEQLGGTDWGRYDPGAVARAIASAFDQGLVRFDTADVYGLGESERRLSAALNDRRKDAVIITKGGVRWEKAGGRAKISRDNSPAYLESAIEASLDRLRIDCIDMYFVHWPDETTALDEVIDVLIRAREAGKIARFGLSNFPSRSIIEAHLRGATAAQLSFNLLSTPVEREALERIGRIGLNRYGYGALAQGLLSGKYDRETQFGDDDRRHRLRHFQPESWPKVERTLDLLDAVARKYERSLAEIALQATRQAGLVEYMIVGIKSTSHVQSIASLDEWTLDEQEVADLLALGLPSSNDARYGKR